jgi:hypothetical protein
MISRGNAMLFDDPDAPAAAPISKLRTVALTPLFGLPLPAADTKSGAPECGGCTRFKPVSPFEPVTGRCKLGIRPGFINRRTAGCGIHRANGTPAKLGDRAVRA